MAAGRSGVVADCPVGTDCGVGLGVVAAGESGRLVNCQMQMLASVATATLVTASEVRGRFMEI